MLICRTCDSLSKHCPDIAHAPNPTPPTHKVISHGAVQVCLHYARACFKQQLLARLMLHAGAAGALAVLNMIDDLMIITSCSIQHGCRKDAATQP